MATTNSLREWRSVTITRDVLFEILRGSSALAYLSGSALEQNIEPDVILNRKLGKDGIQNWMRDFQTHMNELRRAQVLVSRDLNILFDQPKEHEILKLLSSYDHDFQDIKSVRKASQQNIYATYTTTQKHMPTPGQNSAQGNNPSQLESIRQSLAYRNQGADKPIYTPLYTTEATYSRTNVQPSSIVHPPSTVQPSTVQPSIVQPSTVQPSSLQPSRVQPSTIHVLNPDSMDSGPVVTPAKDVLIQESRHYRIKNQAGFSAQYMSPDEGFVQTLNEENAVISDRLTTTPSSYIRVIKEYKGEEYILKGSKLMRQDGNSRSPTPIRHSIMNRSKSPGKPGSARGEGGGTSYTNITKSGQYEGTNLTPHTTAVNKNLFKDDPKADKSSIVVSNFDPAVKENPSFSNQAFSKPQNQTHRVETSPYPARTSTAYTVTQQASTITQEPQKVATSSSGPAAPQVNPVSSTHNPSAAQTTSTAATAATEAQPSLRLKQPRTVPPLADDISTAATSSIPPASNVLSASQAHDMFGGRTEKEKPTLINLSALQEDGRLPVGSPLQISSDSIYYKTPESLRSVAGVSIVPKLPETPNTAREELYIPQKD
jgi:hypothetical protein